MNSSGQNSSQRRIDPAPYQLVALSKIVSAKEKGLLICDGVGVGKTISSGYIVSYFVEKNEGPVIIICPPTLLTKWYSELYSKFTLKSYFIRNQEELETAQEESKKEERRKSSRIYILSSSLLNQENDVNLMPGLLIIDEIHHYRNAKTISFKKIYELSKKAIWKVGLSATPIHNTLNDLISEYQILFSNVSSYGLEGAIKEIWYTKKFQPLIPFTTRFEKEKLNIHFAKRKIKNYYVDLDIEYANIINKIVDEQNSSKGSNTFEKIILYRLASSSPNSFFRATNHQFKSNYSSDNKFQILKKILSEINAQAIIFCEFRGTAEYIFDFYRESEAVQIITGDTPVFKRMEIIERFKEKPNGILILTSVGSEGLDMQFCSQMINYDISWNPMIIEQRIGRIDRVGQKKDEISISNVIVNGSIDDRILEVLIKKIENIKYSIFSSKEIIENTSTKKVLYSPDVEKMETVTAKKLIQTIEENVLEINDYPFINIIDNKYCDPEIIKEISQSKAELPWFLTDKGYTWKKQMGIYEDNFFSLIYEYS